MSNEAERELKTVVARFTESVAIGQLVVNADRQTGHVPRYRLIKINKKSAYLQGVDGRLDFFVKLSARARRSFKPLENSHAY